MRKLDVLLIEDSEDDADLLLRELARGGFEVTHERVLTEEALREALARRPWDIILSDYGLPEFDGYGALKVVLESGLDIPFIIVSGTIGEEAAVDALRAGAQDFLVKGRWLRLLPAIDRELREKAVRAERRVAEIQRQEADARYRQIFETSQEGIWVVDRDSRTVLVNARMGQLLGAPPSELVGTRTTDFTDTEWLLAGEVRPLAEVRFHNRAGVEFWGSVSASQILDYEGRVTGALAMVSDISERRQLQAQLMVADRMASIGLLAAGVGHEINNPLSAAFAMLDAALLECGQLAPANQATPGWAELKSDLAGVREAIVRIRDIVRDLRILSRGDAQRPAAGVELQPIIESAVRLAWNEIHHRARLVKEYGRVPLAQGDEQRLGQVFLNLLVNAAHAIPEGRAADHEIRICTRLVGAQVEVEIRDSGAGMGPDVVRQLFTPFFTTKPVGLGTGLGLSICHRLISSFGGTITVESEVGRGTSFRVRLPIAESERVAPQQTPAPAPSRPGARRASILLIDDDVLVTEGMRRLLGRDHEVRVVNNSRVALELLREGARFDLILCDLMMPDMTGMDLYDELALSLPAVAAQMIFLTGGAFTPRAAEFLATVATAHLDKPVDMATLRALIAERLRKPI
jgi:PAS domain S-box-containing protein